MATVRELQKELDDFKAQVRATAIRVADEQEWCPDGLNKTLKELGLKPTTDSFTVSVTATFTVEDTGVSENDDLVNDLREHLEYVDLHDAEEWTITGAVPLN